MADSGRIFLTLFLTIAIPVVATYVWITQFSSGGRLFPPGVRGEIFVTTLELLSSYSIATATVGASYVPIATLAAGGFFGGLGAGNAKNGFIGGLMGFFLLFVLMVVTYPASIDTFVSFFRVLMQDSEFYLNIGVLFGLLAVFPAIIGGLFGTAKEN